MFAERVTTLSPWSAETGMKFMSRTPQAGGELAELRADRLEDLLGVVDEVHLVDADDEVGHAEQRGEEGVAAALLGDARCGRRGGSSATSAVEAPVTMLRVYWMCPGVSAMMNLRRGVAK